MASWNEFIPSIEAAEGGYQYLSSDKGNYNSLGQKVGTNRGISAKLYEQVIGRPPSISDMKAITRSEALGILKTYFWDKIKASYINNQAVAETFADMAINAYHVTATKLMQKVLNTLGFNVDVDGIVGSQTLEAINAADPYTLFSSYNKAREDYYHSLGNSSWINVWINRVEELNKKHLANLVTYVTEKPVQTSIFGLIIATGIGFLIYRLTK